MSTFFQLDISPPYRNSVLGNLFISEGSPGPVLKIHCKRRTGEKNLVTCMREILADAWPDQSLGMGGVFNIVKGKAKFHIMPDFSPCPINTDVEVNEWLKVEQSISYIWVSNVTLQFYEMKAPLTVLSVLVSR